MVIFGIHLSASDIWLLSCCGILIMALIGYRLTINAQKHSAFITAATVFRNKVLNALEGIYPVARSWWDESLFPKFQQSVPIIETAVAEFRYFVKRKTAFDAAIKDYRDYCQQRKYVRGAPHMTYENSPALPKPETDPIEEFKNIVEHLLSFTERK
jgi:hypothetical protein